MRKILFVLCCLPAIAQSQDTARMGELVRGYAEDFRFNGTVLVAMKGKPVFTQAAGWSHAEPRQGSKVDGIFQIGSVTKQMTAALVMKLQEMGKLNVQDKLSKYFPNLPHAGEITLHQLLTHTSGLHNYTDDQKLMERDVTVNYTRDSMLAIFAKYPLDFTPGSKWSYSNTGYSMLGYVIEKVTGMPYEKAMRRYIFGPLGMTSTGFDFTHLKNPRKTEGYFGLTDSRVNPSPIVDSTISFSAGAVYSTVFDLLKWANAVDQRKILSAASWKTILTPYKKHYGYGWSIDSLDGHLTQSHSGGIHGYSSYMLRLPNDGITVIALDNHSGMMLGQMTGQLAELAMGKQVTAQKKTVALTAAQLTEYTGDYALEQDTNFHMRIFSSGDQIWGQATGQQAFEIFPSGQDEFFLKLIDAQMKFVRDAQGKISAISWMQKGLKEPELFKRTNGTSKAPAKEGVQLDEKTLEEYVGDYELDPAFHIKVVRSGNQLLGQATDQAAFELYASAKDKFYLKVADAQVDFVRDAAGKVVSLVLHQNGMDMPGQKK